MCEVQVLIAMGLGILGYVRALAVCTVVIASIGLSGSGGYPALAQDQEITCAIPPAIDFDEAKPSDDDDDVPTRRDVLESGLERLVRTFARCQSDGDFATMSRLVTEKYLGQVYGGGPRMSRTTFLTLADALPTPPVRFRAFDDMAQVDEGTIRANVKLIVGNQMTFEQFRFIEEPRRPGTWLIDSATPLHVQPPREHSEIEVTLAGNQFSPPALTAAGPNIQIRITNNDIEDHEFLLLRLVGEATVGSILISAGPGLPPGVEYLAQVTVPGGTSTSVVLVNMKPGTYPVVDLLPTDTGVPHLALGMQGTLTVTESD